MFTAINPQGVAPSPFYSQGILVPSGRETLYVSGQVGVAGDGSVPETIGEQTRLAIESLHRVLDAAGMTTENVAKYTIYLTDPADMPGFIEAAGAALPATPPATTLLVVKALASPALKIEIEAVALR